MKLHFFDTQVFDGWHLSRKPRQPHSARHDNWKYGTMLAAGIPAVALGSMYLVDTLFTFFIR